MKWMIVFLMMFVLVGGVFAEEQEVEEAEPQVTYTSNELRTDTDPSEHIPGTLLPGDDTIAVSTGSNGNDENDPEALSPANNPGS
ncbi:MAG: hypothetical protein ACMXYE_05235, partial [Candidatus Woesearchaeota archaeon]